ncbi:DUF4325 domain-containing protein [Acetobacter suratthaniensis]|uniref:DUF4325 domain-containing protein n=1 Tax=Acetobacter suratthaniensis TaxID=1502841 RepID=A0ABS3LQ82_9PROT|nr:DUF4325 domain-containing protein [Acetobacter suratthaniensis]MBO1329522.1 DUF4325 domain-containing protein [Acetobacter suratthaniensis]MCX2567580.1 DUF4325 domain-containing protein [Acetobacter suratthaniensis]
MPPKPFACTSDNNIISVSGGLDPTHFRNVTAAIYDKLERQGNSSLTLNFADLEQVPARAMLPIVAQIIRYKDFGHKVSLIEPNAEHIKKLFRNSNWSHLIDDNYPVASRRNKRHLPAEIFASPSDQHHLVNELMEKIISGVENIDREHFSALEWAVNEITDNVLVHSESLCGGLVQLTTKSRVKKIEFVVADTGIGIAKSLKHNSNSYTSDTDALSNSILQGVTRDKSIGQGNGLYGSYQIAALSGGYFGIYANNASLYMNNGNKIIKREEIPYSGSVVVAELNYAEPIRLSEALRFGERGFSPYDYVDVMMDKSEDGVVYIHIKDEVSSVGSRTAGEPLRIKIANLLRLQPDSRIVLDFSGTRIISSSFADEVIAKNVVHFGFSEFMDRVRITEVENVTRSIIDKSVNQRMMSLSK